MGHNNGGGNNVKFNFGTSGNPFEDIFNQAGGRDSRHGGSFHFDSGGAGFEGMSPCHSNKTK